MIHLAICSSCSCDSFSRTFIIKGNANNERNPHFCPFPVLLTPFPVIAFFNEEAKDCINEGTIGAINEAAIIAPRNPTSCYFISCFTASVVSSINRLDFSSDSTVLIISAISSFEINKVNPLLALIAPFRLTLSPNLFIAFEAAFEDILLTNLDKISLATGTAISVTAFLTNSLPSLPNLRNI